MRTARELYDTRQRLGLRVADVARQMQVPIQQVVAIESGEPDVLPPPEQLKRLLPALAAALGLDAASVTRRYLLELHHLTAPELTAPELATEIEAAEGPTIQPAARAIHAFPSEREEELAVTPEPAPPVDPDLPLHPGIPGPPAAPPAPPGAIWPRAAGSRGLAISVSLGFVAGLLLTIAFLYGTPPPLHSARAADAPPALASPDRQAATPEAPPHASVLSSARATESSEPEKSSSEPEKTTVAGRAPAGGPGSPRVQPAAPETPIATRQPSAAAPGPSPAPEARTAPTVAEPGDTADLSGSWLVTNRVASTSYRAYQNLQIGYRLRLTQRGTRVVGEGWKWVEDGRPLPRARRTPIKVAGTLGGRWLELHFIESGARRQSAGAFVMRVAEDGTLQGSFTSDAANSSGSTVATRETDDAQ